MTDSLWRILLKLDETDAELTCDECFVILEYLADQAANGVEKNHLLDQVREHVVKCPQCYEHHLQRLRELEAELDYHAIG